MISKPINIFFNSWPIIDEHNILAKILWTDYTKPMDIYIYCIIEYTVNTAGLNANTDIPMVLPVGLHAITGIPYGAASRSPFSN